MIEPVVREVWVQAAVESAFRRFTAEIAAWWPTAEHSVSAGGCRDVRFGRGVGEPIEEEADDGTLHRWGTVTVWEPPARVAFTWHPGREPETAQEVEVGFAAEAGGTRVRLTHTGWEKLGASAADMRRGYDSGWAFVLGRYAGSWPEGPWR